MLSGETRSQSGKPVRVKIEMEGNFASLFIDSEISGEKKTTEISMDKSYLPKSIDVVILSVVEEEEYEVAALLKKLKEKL